MLLSRQETCSLDFGRTSLVAACDHMVGREGCQSEAALGLQVRGGDDSAGLETPGRSEAIRLWMYLKAETIASAGGLDVEYGKKGQG